MKAEDVQLTALLHGPKQFIVPVFQRDYSWGTKHCQRLWDDIKRVGSDPNAKAHFVGSIVYVAAEDGTADIMRWLLIDGQQRLTTLLLLLTALRDRLPSDDQEAPQADDGGVLPTRAELDDYYLRNLHGRGDRRHKLHLRRADHATLTALLDGREPPRDASERVRENFEFFSDNLAEAELYRIYQGIKRLVAVDVSLVRGQDDPQMIFESLNSTGLDLTQADLIRNFVLMRQSEADQTRLYQEYWQHIEAAFGTRYRSEFDKFMRDHLTLELKPSKQFKSDEIYQRFREYFLREQANSPVEDILATVKRFSSYYVASSLGLEECPKLKDAFGHLRTLIEVASPVVMKLYDYYSRTKTLTREEFLEALQLLESYVFRRSVCDMQTRSLGQIFATLAYRIKEDSPLLSLKVALYRLGKKRRFPSDREFREALEARDVYDMRNCRYLLDRLENDSRERIDTSSFTIEHVMPQNEEPCPEWRAMLGPNWEEAHETWLHRLGNVTLTAYNQEYSDLPFAQKKTLVDDEGREVGFNFSPLRLNKYIREQESWTATEMERRGKQLATKAVRVWPALQVDMGAVREAELEDRRLQAARYRLEDIKFDSESKVIFDQLRPQILALGKDVLELCGAKTVTYRVYDFFVEVIPRRRKLFLNLNLDYEECDDPSGRVSDAGEWSFITHAAESGGVVFSLQEASQIASALHVIRQAYENISE